MAINPNTGVIAQLGQGSLPNRVMGLDSSSDQIIEINPLTGVQSRAFHVPFVGTQFLGIAALGSKIYVAVGPLSVYSSSGDLLETLPVSSIQSMAAAPGTGGDHRITLATTKHERRRFGASRPRGTWHRRWGSFSARSRFAKTRLH